MHYLGIHKEGKSTRCALIEHTGKELKILHLCALENDVKPLYILDSHLQKKKVFIATGLKSSDVLLRELQLELTKKSAIKEALPFQLESLLPYPSEEAVVVPVFDKAKEGATAISIYATKESFLKEHLSELESQEIDPNVVSCIPDALKNIASHLFPNEPLFLSYLGEKESTFCLIVNNKLLSSQCLHMGKEHFVEALNKDLGYEEATIQDEIDLTDIQEENFPYLFRCVQQFRKDFERMLSFMKKKTEDPPVENICLLGPLLSFCNAREFLLENAKGYIPLKATQEFETYALSIGLAFSCKSESVQFREGPFASPKQTLARKRVRRLVVYASLALTALTLVGGQLVCKKKENVLYETLVSFKGEKKEKSFAKEIAAWEDSLNLEKKPFAYALSAPNISEVLSWISTHPLLKEKAEVLSLRYSLTKHPKLGEASGPYQAKIELELTADGTLAEAFRSSLQEGEGLANNKLKIEWQEKNGICKASFFLKNARRSL